MESVQGKSYGAILLIKKIAKELGILKALGNNESGKLALWQVIGRVLFQGSRLSLIRALDVHAAQELLSLKEVTAKKIYTNLSWVEKNQIHIEQELQKRPRRNHRPGRRTFRTHCRNRKRCQGRRIRDA